MRSRRRMRLGHGRRRDTGGGRRRAARRGRPLPGEPLTVATAAQSRPVRVVRVTGGHRLVRRLAALGVVPGARITVDRGSGPALIEVGYTRVAIDRRVARSVEVEECDP